MNCVIATVAAVALLGGSAATMSVSEQQHDTLRKLFSDDLDQKYEAIITERRNQYLQGLGLGAVFALVLSRFIRMNSTFYRISFFTAIMLATAAVFYGLMPKSDYMLNHLKTAEENKAWLEVYKTMKFRYIVGALLGAAAAIPLSMAFC